MSQRDQYIKYLYDTGITPRLNEILEKLCAEDPWPEEPLYYMLQQLGCPLIPIEQMEELEQKVNAANDEIRYLQRILCNMGYEHECRYVLDPDLESHMFPHVDVSGGIGMEANMSMANCAEPYTNDMQKTITPTMGTTPKIMGVPPHPTVPQPLIVGGYKEEEIPGCSGDMFG